MMTAVLETTLASTSMCSDQIDSKCRPVCIYVVEAALLCNNNGRAMQSIHKRKHLFIVLL